MHSKNDTAENIDLFNSVFRILIQCSGSVTISLGPCYAGNIGILLFYLSYIYLGSPVCYLEMEGLEMERYAEIEEGGCE